MLNFIEIARRNAATFYDAATGERYSLRYRYIVLMLVALVSAISFGSRENELYDGIITSQAILVGFSFNVMVFLASRSALHPPDATSLEQARRAARLNKLAEEIFFSLSYFNLIAISSVLLALMLVASSAESVTIDNLAQAISTSAGVSLESVTEIVVGLNYWTGFLLTWALYFLVLDAVFTFTRVIRRSSYFFLKKIEFERLPPAP